MALGEKLRKAVESLRKATVFDKAAVKEASKELQRALIASDVEVKLVLGLTKKIEEEAMKEKLPKGLNRREHVLKVTYGNLVELLGGTGKNAPEKPRKILLCGLFGSGKCVHPDTVVPLADGRIEKIKDIYENNDAQERELPGEGFVKEGVGLEVFSASANLKICKAKATTLWKLKKTEDLIKIKLDNGNNHHITVTPEHPFFILEEGVIKQMRADGLRLGQYVALPKKLCFNQNARLLKQKFLENISDEIKIQDTALAENVRKAILKEFKTITKAYKSLHFDFSYCELTSELKRNIVRGCLLKRLSCPANGIKENPVVSFAKSNARPVSFPLKFSSEFAEFLGYVLGDGYLYKGYVEISNENREIIERFSLLAKKLFGKEAKIKRDERGESLMKAQVASQNLVKLLNKIFEIPIKKKSDKIVIPKILMVASKKQKLSFLQAYFDCDGYVAEKKRSVEFVTASRKFAKCLRLLLLDCGFHSTFSKKIIKERPYFRIFLKSKDAELFAKEIESRVKKKRERLLLFKKIGTRQSFGKHEILPVGKLLRETREYYGATIGEIQTHVNSYGGYEGEGLISRNSLRKFLSAVKKTKNLNNQILQHAKRGTHFGELLENTGQSTGWLNACLYRLKELNLIDCNDLTTTTTKKGMLLLEKTKTFDETKIRTLEALAESDIIWIKISGIELDKETEFVYDLTVDDYHNFVANEIMVHNTTTVAKIAKHYMKRGMKIGVIAADTYRPAAVEQLEQLCERIKVKCFGIKNEKNAAKVVEKALKELKGFDLIIADSAGRSGFDKDLVTELKEINKAFKPEEKWLVLGADVGQLAKKQAQAFHDAVGVNGVIITRIDGSAKGGGALAACAVSRAPVYFLGTGEKLDDLQGFDAQRYLSRIMGYGDLQALLEKAKEVQEEEELSPEELLKGEFNLDVFYKQLKATRKMGSLSKVSEMLGLKMQVPKEMLDLTEEKLDGFKVMMDSMTRQEKLNPDVLNRSRIQRVAKGSGKKEADVRELIKSYKQMANVFKKFRKLDETALQKKGGGFDMQKLAQMFGKKKKKKFRVR